MTKWLVIYRMQHNSGRYDYVSGCSERQVVEADSAYDAAKMVEFGRPHARVSKVFRWD